MRAAREADPDVFLIFCLARTKRPCGREIFSSPRCSRRALRMASSSSLEAVFDGANAATTAPAAVSDELVLGLQLAASRTKDPRERAASLVARARDRAKRAGDAPRLHDAIR